MTNAELKDALVRRSPVKMVHPVYGKMTFACVSGIIYRADENGRIRVSAEVTDKNGRSSVVIVEPRYIKEDT